MEPLEPWRVWTQVGVVLGAVGLAAVRPLPVLRIVAAGMVTMVGYGTVQDQFSARLCPEYFTVAHPPIPGVTDPTLLGLAWGLLGGWWGGFLLGLGMAAAARLGPRPPAPAADIARAFAGLICGVGFASAAAGLATWHATEVLGVSVGEPWATLVPPDRHRGLVAVTVTHVVTYATAVVGGVAACVWVGLRRPAE